MANAHDASDDQRASDTRAEQIDEAMKVADFGSGSPQRAQAGEIPALAEDDEDAAEHDTDAAIDAIGTIADSFLA